MRCFGPSLEAAVAGLAAGAPRTHQRSGPRQAVDRLVDMAQSKPNSYRYDRSSSSPTNSTSYPRREYSPNSDQNRPPYRSHNQDRNSNDRPYASRPNSNYRGSQQGQSQYPPRNNNYGHPGEGIKQVPTNQSYSINSGLKNLGGFRSSPIDIRGSGIRFGNGGVRSGGRSGPGGRGGGRGGGRSGSGGGRSDKSNPRKRMGGMSMDNGSNAAISNRINKIMTEALSLGTTLPGKEDGAPIPDRKTPVFEAYREYEADIGSVMEAAFLPFPSTSSRPGLTVTGTAPSSLTQSSAIMSYTFLSRAAAPLGVAGFIPEHFGAAVRRLAHPVAPQFSGFMSLEAPTTRSPAMVVDPVSDVELKEKVKFLTAGSVRTIGTTSVTDIPAAVQVAADASVHASRIATLNGTFRVSEVDGLVDSIKRTLRIAGPR